MTDYNDDVVKKWSFSKFKDTYQYSIDFRDYEPSEREKALQATFKKLGGKLKEE